jgi:hypothetical protein
MRSYVPFDLQRLDLHAAHRCARSIPTSSGRQPRRLERENRQCVIEEIFDTPELAKNFRMWASVRFVFPTGGSTPFGAPSISGRPRWARATRSEHGITFGPVARYFMSYHATEPNANKVRRFPFPFHAPLADAWSLVSYPENRVIYNDVTHKWFAPIDLMLLKRPRKSHSASEGAYALVRTTPCTNTASTVV